MGDYSLAQNAIVNRYRPEPVVFNPKIIAGFRIESEKKRTRFNYFGFVRDNPAETCIKNAIYPYGASPYGVTDPPGTAIVNAPP